MYAVYVRIQAYEKNSPRVDHKMKKFFFYKMWFRADIFTGSLAVFKNRGEPRSAGRAT